MQEDNQSDEKGIVSSKQPILYVNIIDFLTENGFVENKSEIVRKAIDKKLKKICKLQMESDKVFDKLLDGMKIVSYHLRQDQIDVIEILVRLGIYSGRSEFIRDAIGEYIIDLRVLSEILKEREETMKDTVIRIPTVIQGEHKTICVTKDRIYYDAEKP